MKRTALGQKSASYIMVAPGFEVIIAVLVDLFGPSLLSLVLYWERATYGLMRPEQ
jgi:hypothetical protein